MQFRWVYSTFELSGMHTPARKQEVKVTSRDTQRISHSNPPFLLRDVHSMTTHGFHRHVLKPQHKLIAWDSVVPPKEAWCSIRHTVRTLKLHHVVQSTVPKSDLLALVTHGDKDREEKLVVGIEEILKSYGVWLWKRWSRMLLNI